ncbi:S9 family peptidase [Microbulbifer sp. 2205BS26-8]|uniref:alpha/beta hydrolase family protein n=1 Tax=Microbulbifer sp. 2205BS26-8 TaxID=3064386 RepID=UPI00273D6932|nr:prolyl oligopeptidase family serine peptidase [Microbulbifer sp. 2205BS26-8]MDP5210352.1 prolyl oligopeptidase family serine peptidase [Microbulbifer sp. 2205BS26-8]
MKPRILIQKLFFLAVFSLAFSYEASASSPYPLEYWALRDVIRNVELSPDGKHVALLKIPTKDGMPIIEVYKTDAMDQEPYRINSDPMEIQSFYWAADDVIIMGLRQKVRDKIDGFNQGVYERLLASVDIKRKKLKKYDDLGSGIEHLLPKKKNKIIYSYFPGGGNGKIKEAFRPRTYYELDLKTGAKKLILRGKLELGAVEFDGDGVPWLARGFDAGKGEFIWYERVTNKKKWREIYRLSEDSFETFSVVGFDEKSPNIFFVRAQNGKDKIGLWEFDVQKKVFSQPIYLRNDVDVAGVSYHSNSWTNPDTVVGVRYYKDGVQTEYFDSTTAAMVQQLQGIIPNADLVRVTSRDKSGNSLVILNVGARDPGSYYLLHKGKLTNIGSRQPLLEADQLADVRYIEYRARDGKKIPAYLTVPNGEPPFPAVVMPHGGPFVSEVVLYDEWAQMLANNGYLVLQPQYRGSLGYGLEHYTSAFKKGGQGGYKMQDDKDDGMLYLVKEGLADPERLAMFGWSYGGYAALVAASRKEQIYQCAIAGAAVADPLMQVNYYRYRMRGAQKEEQLSMWGDSVSPLEQAAEVNIPLLLIHGSVDQRVPPIHAEKYRKALDAHGKNYKYVELEGADHFSNTLFFNHQKLLFESMIAYLKNDCGPSGL